MQQLVVILVLIPLAFTAEVALRATKAKGKLLCGNEPIEGARVRLYRMNSEEIAETINKITWNCDSVGENIKFSQKQPGIPDKSQILDYKVTTSSGTFQVEGNTQGRPINETTLTPVVRIYHKCGEDPKKDRGYRRMQFQIPSEYVFHARTAKEAYDMGTLNLQLIYPGEKREKHFEE